MCRHYGTTPKSHTISVHCALFIMLYKRSILKGYVMNEIPVIRG